MKTTNLTKQHTSNSQQPVVASSKVLDIIVSNIMVWGALMSSRLISWQNNNAISTSTNKNTARAEESLIYQYRYVLISLLAIVTCTLFVSDAFAATLEQQLDSINALTTDKIKKYGITGATIAGGIWAIIKGNVKLAGIIVLIGIILGYYLEWIAGGMSITGTTSTATDTLAG